MTGIVVGIDGSPAADAALAFALAEAKLRNLPLRIVCAWEIPPLEYAGAAFNPTPDLTIEAEHHADAVLAAANTIGPEPGIHIETVSVHGPAATVLQEQSLNATLLVVGTRSRSGLASLTLGSVSQSLAHRCTRPLVIIPAPRTELKQAADRSKPGFS